MKKFNKLKRVEQYFRNNINPISIIFQYQGHEKKISSYQEALNFIGSIKTKNPEELCNSLDRIENHIEKLENNLQQYLNALNHPQWTDAQKKSLNNLIAATREQIKNHTTHINGIVNSNPDVEPHHIMNQLLK